MEHTEGLAKPVMFPEVTEWGQLFCSFTTDKGQAPRDVPLGAGAGRIHSYVWMPKGRKSGYSALQADYEDKLRERVFTDLALSFRAVSHAKTGYTLLIAEYHEIIGNHWLAYVKTDTLPEGS